MRHHEQRRSLARIAVGALLCAAALAACTPPPPDGSTTTTTYTSEPTPPSVQSFSIKGGVQSAPSLVSFAWKVTDPNGDPLTCRIDADGDGSFEVTVDRCEAAAGRNVLLSTPGSYTATLLVEDASSSPVSATTPLVVPSGGSEPFDIELRGVEDLDPAVAAVFRDAVARWERVIVRGLPDVTVPQDATCLPSDVDPLPEVVDDLIIDVATKQIDDVGGILGQAGPTCIPLTTELPYHGVMEFDVDDVADMLSDGTLDDVIAHELGHVLGIGTLWDMSWAGPEGERRLLSGRGGSNPTFVGPRGAAEWSVLGGAGNVPVEGSGGSGTRDSHWRESTFGDELMTGYVGFSSNPLSKMSIASLADMGYHVDPGQADAYSLQRSGSLRRQQGDPHGEVLRPPLGVG
jgi:hypothetical protein